MIHVGIAEDDASYAEQLQKYLLRYQEESGVTIKVDLFSDGMQLVQDYAPIYDLLILDISMPLLDGMKTAEAIRTQDPAVLIMFITSMKQYAIESYRVDAFDYVLKPIRYCALQMKLDKAVGIIERRASRYIMIRTEGADVRIDVSEITYIEVLGHHVTIHTESGDYETYSSLKKVEADLAPDHFSRCNKDYLVNLQHVVYIGTDVVRLTEGTELAISRLRRKEFLQAAADYYGNGGQ